MFGMSSSIQGVGDVNGPMITTLFFVSPGSTECLAVSP